MARLLPIVAVMLLGWIGINLLEKDEAVEATELVYVEEKEHLQDNLDGLAAELAAMVVEFEAEREDTPPSTVKDITGDPTYKEILVNEVCHDSRTYVLFGTKDEYVGVVPKQNNVQCYK